MTQRATKMSGTHGSGKSESKSDFKWTDDEAELLLNVTHNCKVSKISENVDWESVKSKYDDILTLMKEELPASADEAKEMCKDYPHTKEELTKKILSAKVKAIRGKFREAVDSGRKSGHGRVVLLYYELCEKIWGGSPATEQLETGIESSNFEELDGPGPSSIKSGMSGNSEADRESLAPESSVESTEEKSSSGQETVQQRREYLDAKLKSYKTEKMKRKLPVDTQLLACAREELSIKKRLVEQMDSFEKNIVKICPSFQRIWRNLAIPLLKVFRC